MLKYYLLIIFIAYIMGSSSMSFYLMKLKNVELRDKGSKNLGASNATMIMGWKYGILVGIHDIGKAALAVILAKYFFSELPYAGIIAGVSCVLGHMFPFYLKFKGGKGFASYYGMTLALNWKLGLLVGLGIVIVTLVTDYIVAGTILTVISVPIYYAVVTLYWISPALLCLATLIILYKHRMNFVRMLKGTEPRFRSVSKKKR